MTAVWVFAASILSLTLGWILSRVSGRARGAPQTGGERVLLDQSPVGTLLLDPALRITWANDAFCDLFGLIRSDLIGRGFAEVVREDLRPVVTDPDAVETGLKSAYTSASQGSPFNFYVRARDDRDERLLEHTCQVIEDTPLEGGRVAYFVDVTPGTHGVTPQEAETQLHELERILVKLARKSGSPDADETFVIREVAEMVASACKPDRWEIWFLREDRTSWKLAHLHYTTPRREAHVMPTVVVPQTGSYLRALEEVRVMVSSDLKNDPDAGTLLGHARIEPDSVSRLDIPVRVKGKVVGVLVLGHHTARSWTSGERRFAASIGDRMSLLLESTRAGEAAAGEIQIRSPASLPPVASSSIDGFVHLNEKLRFTFLNPAALRWLDERGLDGSTLIGRTLEDAMKGVKDRSIIAEVRKAIRGGGPARLRRQLEVDGPWLDVDVNPSGTGVSVTVQNRARGRERQAERSLLESETRFRSVVESLREGLIITDLNDRIVYVNSRIIDLTGHRPEDLDGKKAQKLLFDTSNWPDKASRMAARKEKKRTRYSAPLVDKDGRVLPVEVISTPLRDSDGLVTGVVDAITAVGIDGALMSEPVGSTSGSR